MVGELFPLMASALAMFCYLALAARRAANRKRAAEQAHAPMGHSPYSSFRNAPSVGGCIRRRDGVLLRRAEVRRSRDVRRRAGPLGQALAVYLAIHHRAALIRSDVVTLPKGLLEQFGLSRDSKARSLHALENAFLVAVERSKGRAARITLQQQQSGTDRGATS
jgi:hypothetical protein